MHDVGAQGDGGVAHSCGVDTVAMEATGVYWVPVYEVLGGRWSSSRFSSMAVRHGTSAAASPTCLDCQWSQKLHSYGLLTRAFRPAKDIATLRVLLASARGDRR